MNLKAILPSVLCVVLLGACNNEGKQTTAKGDSSASDPLKLAFTVEPAPAWTNLLYRNNGWFGGDGIFAVTRNGVEKEGSAKRDEALIWFSDTMFGDIENDSLKPGFGMINNSIAILDGGMPDSNKISFNWDLTKQGKPKSLFLPTTPKTNPGDYYWLGDGFVNQEKNNDLYIFGYRIRNIPNVKVFGFSEEGNTLIVIPAGAKPPFTTQRQMDIPFFADERVDSVGSFGAGVLVNTAAAGAVNPDGYLYIYGVRGKQKEVLVARVKPAAIESFKNWTFWNGSEWVTDAHDARPILDQASNELSVSALPDGRYVMVFQETGVGTKIGLRVSKTPYGPFGPTQDVYDVSADLRESKNIFPYNAKAHPVLSEPGELLISYNINSYDFDNDIKKFPHLYRPRFIKVKYKIN